MKRYFIYLFCLLVACNEPQKGYNDITVLYKESVEVLKTKDREKIEKFILSISPDETTVNYFNKYHWDYAGFPEYITGHPAYLGKMNQLSVNDFYNYALKLDQTIDLKNLKIIGFTSSDTLESITIGKQGPQVLYYEEFIKCTDGKDTFRYSFGELLKIDGKWKRFTEYKLR